LGPGAQCCSAGPAGRFAGKNPRRRVQAAAAQSNNPSLCGLDACSEAAAHQRSTLPRRTSARAHVMTPPRRSDDLWPSPSSSSSLLSRLRSAASSLLVSLQTRLFHAPPFKHFVEHLAGGALDRSFPFFLVTSSCCCQSRQYSTDKGGEGTARRSGGGSSSAPRPIRPGDISIPLDGRCTGYREAGSIYFRSPV